MEKELYEAASEGDVTKFIELLQQDRYLVERVSYAGARNVLHIATMHGQEAIVHEVLEINPQLARNLDSQKSSPLHIAAAQGHVQIINKLLTKAPEVCWYRDCQGMSPVHVAAMNGHVEITKKLLSVAPETSWFRDDQGMNPVHVAAMKGHVEILKEMLRLGSLPAMERVHRGQTVLHLCVKHGQLEALKFLVEKLGDLAAAKDDDGETLLHWAARRVFWDDDEKFKQRGDDFLIIEYLVGCKRIEKQSLNSMGKTAKQIFEENPGSKTSVFKYSTVRSLSSYYDEPLFGLLSNPSMLELLSQRREQTMVVMTLIATMAFQAAVNPPGGVWQEHKPPYRAGIAVMASTHPKMYKQLVGANSTAFASSIITIFLLAVQQRVEKGFLLLFSSYVMAVSIMSISISYGGSVLVTAWPETQSLSPVIGGVLAVALGIFGIALLLHPLRWLWSCMKDMQPIQYLIDLIVVSKPSDRSDLRALP